MRLDVNVPEDRRVALTLPDEVPPGDAELVLVVVPRGRRPRSTGRDLLNSEPFGMWQGRTDIEDSAEYAREQREEAWKRAE